MDIKGLTVNDAELRDALLPRLLGRVFHVAPLAVFDKICEAGEIRPNTNGKFPTAMGSTNSFFRNRGCVSFFDYRSASVKQINDSIGKCSPFRLPASESEMDFEPKIAFLFLSKIAHGQLIPWTKWDEEKALSEKIVPFVEAGYPGPVPITLIEEALRVTITFPTDSIAAVLRRRKR
jgi:hypothetical protein